MMKSRTCFSKKDGSPLSEYFSITEAESSAQYLAKEIGLEMIPYRCERCDYWHLSPKNRYTPSVQCRSCRGSDGKPKESYRTREEAERRADILCMEKGIRLYVYRCDSGNGWHLTKKRSY